MRDRRAGAELWQEWDGGGDDLIAASDYSIVYYTHEHVSLEIDAVRRALAEALRRDGVADSLGDAYRMLDEHAIEHGYAGEVDGSAEMYQCDKDGETRTGETVDTVFEVTWVGI